MTIVHTVKQTLQLCIEVAVQKEYNETKIKSKNKNKKKAQCIQNIAE